MFHSVPGPGLGMDYDLNKVLGMGCKGESSRSFPLKSCQHWLERSGEQGDGRSEGVPAKGIGFVSCLKFKVPYIVLSSLQHTFGKLPFESFSFASEMGRTGVIPDFMVVELR